MVSYIQVFSEERLCSQRFLQPWLEVSPSPPADEAGCPLPSPLWWQIVCGATPPLNTDRFYVGKLRRTAHQR